ncbi:MAG: lysophospholipid acyltransferase family protein [Myxococcota bacterium]
MNRRLGLALFGWLSSALLRLLGATWRVEIRGPDPRFAPAPRAPATPSAPPPPVLAALLHESLAISAWLFRDAGYCVAVSQSRDGSLVASTLRALGYAEPARGSSSRGGSAAFLGLLRQLELGTTVAVLVDGPRGPAGVAKPGIAALARHSATPIQPLAFAARPALRLGSWDRTLVPLPFARVVCVFGEPIAPTALEDNGQDEALAAAVSEQLAAIAREATRNVES